MMTTPKFETRQLVSWLDEAIDNYDCGIALAELEEILAKIAEHTLEIDPGFSSRVSRIAQRSVSAVDPSERDIASALARDVRRDLMCTTARAEQARKPCALDAKIAGDGANGSILNHGVKYLGD